MTWRNSTSGDRQPQATGGRRLLPEQIQLAVDWQCFFVIIRCLLGGGNGPDRGRIFTIRWWEEKWQGSNRLRKTNRPLDTRQNGAGHCGTLVCSRNGDRIYKANFALISSMIQGKNPANLWKHSYFTTKSEKLKKKSIAHDCCSQYLGGTERTHWQWQSCACRLYKEVA